jgi:DNA-binding NarL/FixJ family response regulator
LTRTRRSQSARCARGPETLLQALSRLDGADHADATLERIIAAASSAFGTELRAALTVKTKSGPRRRRRIFPKASPVERLRTASAKIKLLVVEHHDLARLGIAGFLAAQPDFAVVGCAASGAEAHELARRTLPDVVLLDSGLPDMDAVQLRRELLRGASSSRVVMLGSRPDAELLGGARPSGVCAFISGDGTPEQLIDAVRRAACDAAAPVPREIRKRTPQPSIASPDDALAALAQHQSRLLPLIAQGRTNREIAAELGLSEYTVKTYVSQILRSLNLKRRAEAASYLTRHIRAAS